MEILGSFYLNGEPVTGVFKTSEAGLYAIESETLIKLITKSPGQMLGILSAKSRVMKKTKAVAVTLAMTMKGYYPYQITGVLEENNLSCSYASISRALSVLKDGDKERLLEAFRAFPEEFEGLTEQDFNTWFDARYADAKKAQDKKERNKRIRELVLEWGE